MLRTLASWLSPTNRNHHHHHHHHTELSDGCHSQQTRHDDVLLHPSVYGGRQLPISRRRLETCPPPPQEDHRAVEKVEEEADEVFVDAFEPPLQTSGGVPAVPDGMSELDDGPALAITAAACVGMPMVMMTTATVLMMATTKGKQVLPPPPRCWCRLAADARMAHMRPADPLHPGRAYWTCANVGCSCNFFQWVEEVRTDRQPALSGASSLSGCSFASMRSRAVPPTEDAASAAARTKPSQGTVAGKVREDAGDDRAVTPKPYRSSAPIPIPLPASGTVGLNRRRTPVKSADEGTDASEQ